MKPTEKQIKEIADNLECGMICYYHIKNGKIMAMPDFDEMYEIPDEIWNEDIKEIENNEEYYFKFIKPDSHSSYRIMADFVNTVEDEELKDRLLDILDRPKPFRNFKWEVDNAGEYRYKWFKYRTMRYIQKVKDDIESNQEEFEE